MSKRVTAKFLPEEKKMKFLTVSKEYIVLRTDAGDNVFITADDGTVRPYARSMFEN